MYCIFQFSCVLFQSRTVIFPVSERNIVWTSLKKDGLIVLVLSDVEDDYHRISTMMIIIVWVQ